MACSGHGDNSSGKVAIISYDYSLNAKTNYTLLNAYNCYMTIMWPIINYNIDPEGIITFLK